MLRNYKEPCKLVSRLICWDKFSKWNEMNIFHNKGKTGLCLKCVMSRACQELRSGNVLFKTKADYTKGNHITDVRLIGRIYFPSVSIDIQSIKTFQSNLKISMLFVVNIMNLCSVWRIKFRFCLLNCTDTNSIEQNLWIGHLVKKLPAFYGSIYFITLFTRTLNWTIILSQMNSVYKFPYYIL
jgi:hypothetical protein